MYGNMVLDKNTVWSNFKNLTFNERRVMNRCQLTGRMIRFTSQRWEQFSNNITRLLQHTANEFSLNEYVTH
jgi:hypothetical protein